MPAQEELFRVMLIISRSVDQHTQESKVTMDAVSTLLKSVFGPSADFQVIIIAVAAAM